MDVALSGLIHSDRPSWILRGQASLLQGLRESCGSGLARNAFRLG